MFHVRDILSGREEQCLTILFALIDLKQMIDLSLNVSAAVAAAIWLYVLTITDRSHVMALCT